jgi:hypothetical protein
MRFFLSVAVVVGMASLAFAAAAELIVNGGYAQAGENVDVTCDEDGVFVSYQDTGGDFFDQATVSDIECEGMIAVYVEVFSNDPEPNTLLAWGGTDCAEITDGEVTVPLTGGDGLTASEIEAVDGVRVAIVSCAPPEEAPAG